MIVPKSNNRFVEQYSRDTPKTIQLPVDKMVYPVQNQGEINQVRQAVDGNAQWISVKVVNAHESQAKKALLFDALGAYTSAKSYTKPAEITVTYPSILKDPFFSLLRSGQKFRIWKVDINQLAPAGSAQMANPLKTYCHMYLKLQMVHQEMVCHWMLYIRRLICFKQNQQILILELVVLNL